MGSAADPSTAVEVVKLVGSLAGITAFAWQVYDQFTSYLRIGMSVSVAGGRVLARTSVENKGIRSKDLEYALLLVGPERASQLEVANSILGPGISRTTDLLDHKVKTSKYDGEHAVIPLSFYYIDNIDISDETMSATASIDTTGFTPGAAYTVRFIVFGGSRPLGDRLHRLFGRRLARFGTRLPRLTSDTFFAP